MYRPIAGNRLSATIIQRGNDRQAIFFEGADRRLFLSVLGDALAAHDGVLYAYVLMTNPFHLPIMPALLRMVDRIDPSWRN